MPDPLLRRIVGRFPRHRTYAVACSAAVLGLLLLGITLLPSIGLILSARASPEILVVPDTRPRVATVLLKGMENGELVGEAHGEVRLFLGESQIIPGGSGAFRVSAGVLTHDVRTVTAPAGMRFVASKKGTRFYPVSSKQARELSPKNRVFFATEEQARAAGYR